MTTQQIYSSNTTRPFPMAEGGSIDLPKDIFVDMSITVPEGVVPVITAIAITPSTFFASLEDSVTRKAIGQIHINSPSAFSVYKFDMPMSGAFGWVVPGPGLNTVQTIRDIEEQLDPSVVLLAPPIPDTLEDITVNSVLHAVKGVLGLETLSSTINITTEVRDIVGEPEPVRCIVLSRNDTVLTQDQLYYAFADTPSAVDAILRIAGAVPDEDGDIQIVTDPAVSFLWEKILTPVDGGPEEEIGIVFNQTLEACVNDTPEDQILHGRCQQGIVSEDGLPCDPLVELIHPEFTQEDCGCGGYTLTVNNGTGSGVYDAGTVVPISASPTAFLIWVSDDIGQVDDPSGATTFVTMPAHNMVVTANHGI